MPIRLPQEVAIFSFLLLLFFFWQTIKKTRQFYFWVELMTRLKNVLKLTHFQDAV